jgi:glycosyltransferase involved in cell wall biosynthesis
MITVACLAATPDDVSARYRTLQYVPHLGAAGIDVAPLVVPARLGGRLRLFRRLARFDVVIVHRRTFNLLNLTLLRRAVKKLVFDVDDAVFLKDSFQGGTPSLTRAIRFRRMLRAADLVIAGNDFIRAEAAKWSARCTVLPTVVDLGRYPRVREHGETEGLEAVWIGSRATLFFLERLLSHLESLPQALPGFRVTVIADAFPEWSGPLRKVTWTEAGEADALACADVGLMPLLDDDWSRGKCGLKLIQYGAAGLPSVCSPVGANRTIVRDGITGIEAREPGEWRDALIKLGRDRDLRARMGREARARIEAEYSVEAMAPRLCDIITGVAAGRG